MKRGRTRRYPWKQLLISAIGAVSLVGMRFELVTAGTTVAHVEYCDCPGCQVFLQECDPRDVNSLQPAVPADQSLTPSMPRDISPLPESMQMAPLAADAVSPSTFRPSPSSLASSLGAGGAGAGVPSMIGDFFGGGYNYQFANGATVATAGGDRRFKFTENNNPFPQDRLFFNFSRFNNALTNVNGEDANLDRFTFGVEKTIFGGRSSVEFRVPFAVGLGTNPGGSDPLGSVTEFGNIALAVKQLLYRGPNTAVSAGLGVVFPTGDGFSVATSRLSNVFENDAYHLLPFLGIYHAPTSRLFVQSFVQFDFDANGNEVIIGGQRGVLQDQTLMFLDASLGYWVYRNRCNQYLRGVAPMIELHYSTTLQDQDYGPFQDSQIFVENSRRDVLNLTGGLYFEIGQMSSLTIGAVAPLRTGSDKTFDSELGVQYTRRY